MKRIVTLWALALTCAAGFPTRAAAQAGVEVSAAQRRLHYTYRFENDSSLDTSFLVPHFFEQRYEAAGWELSAKARYELFGRPLATKVSFAPGDLAFGSDFDTFFQPDGDIATTGTAGDVRLMSAGVEQSMGVLVRARGAVRLRLAFRHDRAEFLPADRVVTHTQPSSETREWITDRETTVSRTFETGLDAEWRHRGVTISGHVSPSVLSRLLVLLPDKYPGRDIVFYAVGWGAGARVAFTREIGGLGAGVWVSGDVNAPYQQRAKHTRTVIAGGLALDWTGR